MATGLGTNTTLTCNDSSYGDFIAEVTSMSLPSVSRNTIDTSHLATPDSTGYGWRTFIAGNLADPGELTVDVFYDPAAEIPIDEQELSYTITFDGPGITTPETWTFDALLTSISGSIPLDEMMTATFTFKLSGDPGVK